MGEILAKLFIDPSTLPGGVNCVDYMLPCDPLKVPRQTLCWFKPNASAAGSVYYGAGFPANGTYTQGGAEATTIAAVASWLGTEGSADAMPPGAFHDGCSNVVGGFFQLLLLLCVYGAVLFKSADVLSEGSELLMFVPSIKDVVGSIVLPILGAVPDGAIVLFSGMGPIEEAQDQLNVGVGALAGSTIMLLTIPWFLSLWAGRVDLVDGTADLVYKRSAKTRLTNGMSLTKTGVSVKPIIRKNAYMMLATGFPCYLIVQIPAFIDGAQKGHTNPNLAHLEHPFAIAGFVMTIVLFCYYLYFQAHNEDTDAVFDQILKRWLNGEIKLKGSLSAILCEQLAGLRALKAEQIQARKGSANHQGLAQRLINEQLEKSRAEDMKRLRTLIKPVYRRYDSDGNGTIDKNEFSLLMNDLNESAQNFLEEGSGGGGGGTAQTVDAIFNQWDMDRGGTIDFKEFCIKFYERAERYALRAPDLPQPAAAVTIQAATKESDVFEDADGDGEDDAEEEEMPPEELISETGEIDLPKLKKTASISMFFGTLVVLVFSDPMVDVLSALGNFIGVAPFYVSFVLAPLASNASELVASMNYAAKRTKGTITTSLSTLLGAANMNNTFCLSIFYALMVFRPTLQWTFSAETIAILTVEVVMFFFAIQTNMKLWTAFVVLSFFPLSIVLVVVLEGAGNMQ
jgi:Ca2+/Na+ antiporter